MHVVEARGTQRPPARHVGNSVKEIVRPKDNEGAYRRGKIGIDGQCRIRSIQLGVAISEIAGRPHEPRYTLKAGKFTVSRVKSS